MNKYILITFLMLNQHTFADWINPKANSGNFYFENQATQNDARFGYSLTDWLNPQLQFVRNHRKNHLELHYAYLKTNIRVLDQIMGDKSNVRISLLPGAGFANKLNGINRFSYTFGYYAIFENENLYIDQTSFGYFAKDYDDKISILANGGFKFEELTNQSTLWFLMNATKETYNTYNITWGPILRLKNKNSYLDIYGTVKGDWGITYAFEFGSK